MPLIKDIIPPQTKQVRDDQWLSALLQDIWIKHFADLPKHNPITIKFGREAKTLLGSIRYNKRKNESKIIINGIFKKEIVPEVVIKSTVAHELTHYLHGFASATAKKARYPHRGSLVDREMQERGLREVLQRQKLWLKKEWPKIVREHFSLKKRVYVPRRGITLRKLLSLLGS